MKRCLFLLLFVLAFSATLVAQNCVLGSEANGSDSATISAYEWRKDNVYPIYAQNGFTVLLVSQATQSKIDSSFGGSKKVTHVTGCGHGSPTSYTGYGMSTIFSTGNTTLLKKMAGAHVHLLSCLTAQQLGPAIIQNGAKSFAGYYPSFYFTWKSTSLFFTADAELDICFAKGMDAPAAYNPAIAKFNEVKTILEQQDPDAVRYIIIDRDGLRCLSSKSREDNHNLENEFSLNFVSNILYAQDTESRNFMTLAEYANAQTRGVSFQNFSDEQFKALTLAAYERCPRDFEIGVIGYGVFHRDALIQEIQNETELGKDLLRVERNFLTAISESRLTHTVKIMTDANGGGQDSGEAEIPFTVTVKGIKANWTGEPNEFGHVYGTLDGEIIHNASVTKGQTYSFTKKIEKGKHTFLFDAKNGPKNTEVEIAVSVSLWK